MFFIYLSGHSCIGFKMLSYMRDSLETMQHASSIIVCHIFLLQEVDMHSNYSETCCVIWECVYSHCSNVVTVNPCLHAVCQ